jgi:hypothetical protein
MNAFHNVKQRTKTKSILVASVCLIANIVFVNLACGLDKNALYMTVRDNLEQCNAKGNTVASVLKSVGLDNKIDANLTKLLDIDLEANIRYDGRISIDNTQPMLWIMEDDERELLYAFNINTGKLVKYIVRFPNNEMPPIPNNVDLEDYIISRSLALEKITKIINVLMPEAEINPDALSIKEPIRTYSYWDYTDYPTYEGIWTERKIHVALNAFTGDVRGVVLLNFHIPLPDKTVPAVPVEEAIKTAEIRAREYDIRVIKPDSTSLVIVRPSNGWSIDHPLEPRTYGDEFRLCWNVELGYNDNRMEGWAGFFCVDALTGEIIGGTRNF